MPHLTPPHLTPPRLTPPRLPFVLFLALALLLTSTGRTLAQSTPAAAVIADRDIIRQIEDRATALIEANATIPCVALADQAQRQLTWTDAPVLTPRADKPLPPHEVYEKACRGTVVVASLFLCGNCDRNHANCASGFVISPDGLVVTNHHVLETNRANITLVVRTWNGRVLPVKEVLAADPANDLAILRIDADSPGSPGSPDPATPDANPANAADTDNQSFDTLPLGDKPRVGQRVHAVSHPDRRFYYYSSGEVAQLRRDNGQADGNERVSITAVFAKGSSGAPVLDEAGNVVAVVASTRSVYYNTSDNGVPQNLQMVFRDCIPADKVAALARQAFPLTAAQAE